MTSSTNQTEDKTWQDLYSAEASRWKDLRRMGGVIIPVFLLLFLAILSAVVYSRLYSGPWQAHITTRLGAYWFVFRLYLTFLFPLFIAAAGIVIVFRASVVFVREFYQHPDEKKILPSIQRKLLGVPPLPPPLNTLWKYPFVTIKEPGDLDENHWTRWLGGPATLVIYDGLALYLERGNRFSRVVGPGKPPMPFLDRFETVKTVVDLRPQVKTGRMNPWTKDGIQVELDIQIEAQINASEEAQNASRNLVYPFDPIAVKQAAEYTAVKSDNLKRLLFESDWLDGVWGQVTGYFSRHISKYSIDEIALSEIEDVGPSEGHLYTIKQARQHLEKINQDLAARRCGASLLSLQVSVKFPEAVDQQRIAFWESQHDIVTSLRNSKAEGDRIRVREEARARVERDMLDAIIERLKRVGPENLTESLLLSLTGILDNSLDDPLVRPLIATQSLDLLERLKKALKERF